MQSRSPISFQINLNGVCPVVPETLQVMRFDNEEQFEAFSLTTLKFVKLNIKTLKLSNPWRTNKAVKNSH